MEEKIFVFLPIAGMRTPADLGSVQEMELDETIIPLSEKIMARIKTELDISIDDLLNGVATTSKLEQGEKLLRDMLSDGSAIKQKQLQQQAKIRNISERTLNEAKKNVGVKSFRSNNEWYWKLSKE